jgi:RanGTP-binding protein
LTKDLRWAIQALGTRLSKAATAEEASCRKHGKVKPRLGHEMEIQEIVQDIRNLLTRIEDAVPLISLAITTSGASMSTALPPSVSPSRMLQASTFLTAADTQYCMDPRTPVQVGPTMTLSLYMLFTSHNQGIKGKKEVTAKKPTFKEVIHKARVKLMRLPLQSVYNATFWSENHQAPSSNNQPVLQTIESGEEDPPIMTGERSQNEYYYRLEIIEDLEDGRVHDFDDAGARPGPYGDVQLAGIREFLPIYQVSRIFYADTGKILGIGNPEEMHNAVLLLRRDIHAVPPRRMMQESEKNSGVYEDPEEQRESESEDDSQEDVDKQIRKESSAAIQAEPVQKPQPTIDHGWRLPADLDSEWLALEVYTDPEESSSEDDEDLNDDSAYISHRSSSSGEARNDDGLINGLEQLHINQESNIVPIPSREIASSPPVPNSSPRTPATYAPIRTSLSLLEMLIRLTSLQEFQQASHLSITDELLNFFLTESSTTGAGADAELRKRTRGDAVRKMGFDPYDESPIKQRGEDYQNQNQGQQYEDGYEGYDRGHTPLEEREHRNGYPSPKLGRARGRNSTTTPEPWLLRSREHSSASHRSIPNAIPSSPVSPYRPQRKSSRPMDRIQNLQAVKGSPLGRGMSAETDSTLGTSPGSPTLVDRVDED